MTLESRGVDFSYGSDTFITDLDLAIAEGKITALVGANGSGKSTILKNLARVLRPKAGIVHLNGKDIQTMKTREVAKRLSLLPQKPDAPEGLLVRDLVAYGRFAWQNPFRTEAGTDRAKIDDALTLTSMNDYASRPLDTLSGGQRQRAWIAMALAQDSDIMLLDEPTTFLDIAHQIEVLGLLRRINRESGKTIVMVLHDLNQALRYADHIVVIKNGKIAGNGPASSVLDERTVEDAFGIAVDFFEDRRSGTRFCIPHL